MQSHSPPIPKSLYWVPSIEGNIQYCYQGYGGHIAFGYLHDGATEVEWEPIHNVSVTGVDWIYRKEKEMYSYSRDFKAGMSVRKDEVFKISFDFAHPASINMTVMAAMYKWKCSECGSYFRTYEVIPICPFCLELYYE